MLRLIGVLPFAILPGYIPKLVFLNGVLLHTQRLKSKDSAMYRILLWNDIICNICLCTYVNIHTCYQPQTIFATVFSLSSFVANFGKDLKRSAFYHIFFVQFPLGFCCFKHHQTCV